MASSRCVLVSYCERNKKVSIPDSKTEDTDIEYLSKECKRSFSFSSNVNIKLTFQIYDPDWEMDVDLEDDYVAKSKDKLKLIVTPLLVDNPTPTPSICLEVSYFHCSHSLCVKGLNNFLVWVCASVTDLKDCTAARCFFLHLHRRWNYGCQGAMAPHYSEKLVHLYVEIITKIVSKA